MIDCDSIVKALGIAAVVYLWRNTFTVIDPTQSIVVERLSLAKNPTLRIVQVSDVHADITWRKGVTDRILDDATHLIVSEHPDVLVLTGDYVNRAEAAISQLEPFFTSLVQAVGRGRVIAVIGNHDTYGEKDSKTIIETMRKCGVTMLINETVVIEDLGLAVVGLGDLKTGSFNADAARQSLDRALAQHVAPDSLELVVLSHNPDSIVELAPRFREARIVLSGHSHGGQIRWPGVGPLAPLWGRWIYPLFPRPLRRYLPRPQFVINEWQRCAGLHVIEADGRAFESIALSQAAEASAAQKLLLYVSRGLGTHPPFRLFCPPEITVIEL